MVESPSLPELLRDARQTLGLSVEEMALRSGVARAHLMELERGSAASFYSLKYCHQAVMSYARALGLEDEARARWSDAEWALPDSPTTRSLSQLDSSTHPRSSRPQTETAMPWVFKAMAVALILAAAGISLFWLSQAETPQSQSVALSGALSEGGSATAPAPAEGGPAIAPLATPAPPSLEQEVQGAFERWLSLWSARQVDPYLAMFDPSFPGWRAYSENRRSRIESARVIEVTGEEVTYRVTAPGEVTVRFVQVYRSDTFNSKDTKELVWRQSPTGPKIIAERRVN